MLGAAQGDCTPCSGVHGPCLTLLLLGGGRAEVSTLGEVTCARRHESSSSPSHELQCPRDACCGRTGCSHCPRFCKEGTWGSRRVRALSRDHARPGWTPPCQAALTRRVAPRLIVGGEDPEVAATDELLIVHGQQGAGGGQELRVENDLATRKKD